MALYLNFEGKDYIGKGKIQLLEFVLSSPNYFLKMGDITYKVFYESDEKLKEICSS